MRHLSRGQRTSLRIITLAAINVGVYIVYVRAIRNAKESGVHGTFHDKGSLHYDEIVGSSYKNYVSGSQRQSSEKYEDLPQ